MNPDPRLSAWLDENIPKLQTFCYKMEGIIDQAAYGAGITPDELKWFRREVPRLCMLAIGAPEQENPEDGDIAGVLKRILRKTAPSGPNGCQRWLGGVQGGQRQDGRKGGTPVIGFKGSTVPARRLLWNLQYEGTPQYLNDKERLRNIQCVEASLCMNLAHWYKKLAGVDRGDVRAVLGEAQLMTPGVGRICQAGEHYIPADTAACPACALDSRRERATVRQLSYAAGMAIRHQMSQQ